MSAQQSWQSGEAYEPYVGRWSRRIARRFLEWLDPPPRGRWLDVGCGTGALTETILEMARPAWVRGVDPSREFVEFARARNTDPRAEFAVEDARRLSGEAGPYDNCVSGLVLNFVPTPAEALEAMKRVTRPGGWIAAYVWDYAEGMEMMRYFWDAAAEVDPGAASLDEGARFPICRPEPLRALWEEAGLREIRVLRLQIDSVFRDFDDYWTPFLGGQGPAPAYNMSLEAPARDAIKDLLRQRLPVESDGSIRLLARAWGVRGRA